MLLNGYIMCDEFRDKHLKLYITVTIAYSLIFECMANSQSFVSDIFNTAGNDKIIYKKWGRTL